MWAWLLYCVRMADRRRDRRKEYKKKKRNGRLNGCKKRMFDRLDKLNDELVSCKSALSEAERERRDWEVKFIDLERYV